jgi:hypothetical protein
VFVKGKIFYSSRVGRSLGLKFVVLAVKRASLARRMANDVTKMFCNIFLQQLKHLFGEDLRETAKNSILKQKKTFFEKK